MGGMGYFAALAITLFLAALVLITVFASGALALDVSTADPLWAQMEEFRTGLLA